MLFGKFKFGPYWPNKTCDFVCISKQNILTVEDDVTTEIIKQKLPVKLLHVLITETYGKICTSLNEITSEFHMCTGRSPVLQQVLLNVEVWVCHRQNGSGVGFLQELQFPTVNCHPTKITIKMNGCSTKGLSIMSLPLLTHLSTN